MIRGNVSRYTDINGKIHVLDFLDMLAEAIKRRSTRIINYKDKHILNQYLICHPCFIKYDYIAKMETMDSDSKYIMKLFNATELPNKNTATLTEGNKNLTVTTVHELLNKLNKNVTAILADYYRNDLDLFSYEVNITRDSSGRYVETGRGLC
jgi:formylmethanofuran dehydrogenase subunit E-like metal-binding protein